MRFRRRGITRIYYLAFSGGTWPIEAYDSEFPGTLCGVGAVSGTCDPRYSKLPKPASSAIIIHGPEDSVLPYNGVLSENGTAKIEPYEGSFARRLGRNLFCRLIGGSDWWYNRPDQQVVRYAKASGLLGNHRITPGPDANCPLWTRDQYGDPTRGDPVVVEYLILGRRINGVSVGAGHTWNGRDREESEFSQGNGDPLPPDILDLWTLFAQEWGW